MNSTVPALVYLAARTRRTAASHMAARVCGIEPRGGAFLDQLLVPPLHRAIALQEVDHVAVVVGDDLHLDVPGMLDVFFEIDFGVAEGGLGLGLGLLDGGLQGQIVQGHAHAAPAAAGRRLDQHRKAELVGQRDGLALALDQPLAAGHGGNVDFLGQSPGGVLVAHQGHRLVRGADELDLATAADLGKMGVFGQKTVARMNRLHVADLGGADDPVDLQVAVGGLGRADAIGFVGQFQVGGAAVGLAEDGHGLDAQLAAGAEDAQGDFAAVGNQDSLEHGYSPVSTLNRGCPNSTGAPFSTSTATIRPETSAGIWLNTFMASTMQTTVSGPTWSPTLTKGGESGSAAA